eukprot:1203456-Prorocentrum_lima.AAC.1
MTSSLVGSEMCIRDSSSTLSASLISSLVQDLASWSLVTLEWIPSRQNGGCLLYTSDAADDM